ncbi:MAG TPA: prolyl oligopeptidase family serine peptidase [Gemmatimonas sp.]|uniref:prolyl oligopeptidase family serine peptidase n=1 Tax=Gemmatimonas sp. TaxID=1962908 RepID=UPI002ED99CB0
MPVSAPTRSAPRASIASVMVSLGVTLAGTASSLLPATLSAQAPASGSFDFTIANIMRGPEHTGRDPQGAAWSPDGQWLYFQWAPAGAPWNEPLRPYRVRTTAGAKPELVTDAHMDSVSAVLADGVLSRDRTRRATAVRGDLYLITVRTGAVRRLTQTAAAEADPRFTADDRSLLFQRDGNAYVLDLTNGDLRQLTDVRNGPAPRDPERATGMRGELERQQLELFDVIRDRQRADSLQRAQRLAAQGRGLPTVYLPAGERLASLSVSPSLKYAVLTTASGPGGFGPGGGGGFGAQGGGQGGAAAAGGAGQPRNTIVPNYVTASGFTEDIPSRTKVGDVTGRSRAYRLDLATGRLQPLGIIANSLDRPASQVRVASWKADGSAALITSSTPDFKWRYLTSVSDTGAVRVVHALNDTAYVGGPCSNCMGWLPNGRVWYGSEVSGYAHLYTANADGSDTQPLTSGKWEVERAELSDDGTSFLLHTSEESPFVRHAYRMAATGGLRTKITREHGGHSLTPSPDGKRFADVYSASNLPPELYVINADGSNQTRLTVSTSEAFRSRTWLKPAIVKIPASDGIEVPARIYRPEDMGVKPNGGAVMFVHGAGYLHNVHDFWSTYTREYMFNQLLASKGYIVLDVDYRASAGYGRDWRTAIYRWMGGRDLADHVDASKWLQKEHGIDPERIGLYGGSYGGFMTLMALFTAPKSFGAGAALRSVTDWAHYNHGYTGGILNLPQGDTLAYRRSSPIFFAEGLEDPLLMAHGMVDTNVHFQDIVRLSQRLIELGKTDWELAVYPVEDHGFVRPDSWTDEYRRIFELFERTIGPNGSKVKK